MPTRGPTRRRERPDRAQLAVAAGLNVVLGLPAILPLGALGLALIGLSGTDATFDEGTGTYVGIAALAVLVLVVSFVGIGLLALRLLGLRSTPAWWLSSAVALLVPFTLLWGVGG